MQGILHYFIGKIDYETEDRPSAVVSYKKSLEYLEAFKFNPKATACFIRTSNDIAVVWTEREEPKKAQEFLKAAEKVTNFFQKRTIIIISSFKNINLRCIKKQSKKIVVKSGISGKF